MTNKKEKSFQLFFHAGLGKTASTYLQYRFFPVLEGIHYIQRTKYRNFDRILERTHSKKYLVSREFDRQFQREMKKIAQKYPHTYVILVLRRHDSWIASQYRRYVKNGGLKPFHRFLDLEKDQGVWQQKDLYFYPKLELIRELFTNPPLILFHDELKKDPGSFFGKIASYTGTTYDKSRISYHPSHKSYSEKQLKIVQNVSKRIFSKDFKGSENRLIHYIRFRSRWLFLHLLLYAASFFPERSDGSDPLIPVDQLKAVRSFYNSDWKKCREFAEAYSYDHLKKSSEKE